MPLFTSLSPSLNVIDPSVVRDEWLRGLFVGSVGVVTTRRDEEDGAGASREEQEEEELCEEFWDEATALMLATDDSFDIRFALESFFSFRRMSLQRF